MSEEKPTLRFDLHARQGQAFNSPATELLYGGAASGGKSFLMRCSAILWALSVPNINIFLFRRLYDDLIKNHLEGPTGFRALLAPFLNASHPKSPLLAGRLAEIVQGEIRFWNGSKIFLCHLQHQKDITKYYGVEIHCLLIEEATQFSEFMIRFLRSRMRMPEALKIPDQYTKPKELWKNPEKKEYLFPRAVYTSNPGGIGHCLTHGEVLTPYGWRDIRDFKPGDPVYTVDSHGALIRSEVEQVHASRYEGEIVEVSARGFHISATPNHKVAQVRETGGFSLVSVDKLPGQATILRSVSWVGQSIGSFTCPEVKTRKLNQAQPLTLSGVQYAALMGWFLSEGCTVNANKAVHIAQSKPYGREKLKELLDSCGFNSRWTAHSAHIFSPSWWSYFKQFGKCRAKFIPQALKDASKEELEALLLALMEGDGHWRARGVSGTYYTISRQLADDVAEVALKLGKIVYVRQRVRKNREGLSYSVSFKNTKSGGTELLTGNHIYSVKTKTKRKSDIVRKQFSGPVYCLGIKDTHTFVVRQNGAVWVSGNSYIKRCFLTGFEPYQLHTAPNDDGGHLRQYIPARVDDNPSVNREAVKEGLAGLPPRLVDAMLNGNWDAVIGAFFPEVSPPLHLVDPFPIPDYWLRFMSYDHGSAGDGDPFACVWFAVSPGGALPRGSLVVYRAWTGKGLPKTTASQIAKGMLDRERNDGSITYRVAGGDILEQRGHGPSIFEIFATEGVVFQRADNRRPSGWMQIRERLVGKNGVPLLYFFKTYSDDVDSLANLQHDLNNVEDCAAGDDHFADALRYGCVSRPFVRDQPAAEKPLAEKFRKPTLNELWELHERSRDQRN